MLTRERIEGSVKEPKTTLNRRGQRRRDNGKRLRKPCWSGGGDRQKASVPEVFGTDLPGQEGGRAEKGRRAARSPGLSDFKREGVKKGAQREPGTEEDVQKISPRKNWKKRNPICEEARRGRRWAPGRPKVIVGLGINGSGIVSKPGHQ